MSVLLDGAGCLPGIYPRSEALVQATRDLARGRARVAAVTAQRRRDRERLLALQREARLAPPADGLLDWQDLFRPLVEATDGLAPGALVRFLDGNTFYRAVDVDGAPRLRRQLPAPELPPGWLGTLPSPFALAHAARHAVTAAQLAESVLAPQLEAWAREDCALVVLAEPFLPREPDGLPELLAALERLPHPLPVALQLPFGDSSPLLAALANAPVDAVGVDFTATPVDALPAGFAKPLLAGVVDARSSRLDEPERIAQVVQALRSRCAAPVLLTPNGDLEHVPEPIAREKVRRLGAATATLREEAAA